MSQTFVRYSVLAAAAQQVAFPFFVNPFRDGAQPVRALEPSQIEPARYAFSIWGPIYLAAIIYAIWQLSPKGRSNRATQRIAPLAILLYLGSSLWLSAAQYGPLWATMPILSIMAMCALASLVIAVRTADDSFQQYLCLIVPFALYAGWTICATFVNVAEVAPQYGFGRFGLSTPDYAILSILLLTGTVGLALWLTRGNVVFAGTVAWALIAIIAAAYQREFSPRVIAAASAALIAVVGPTLFFRNKYREVRNVSHSAGRRSQP